MRNVLQRLNAIQVVYVAMAITVLVHAMLEKEWLYGLVGVALLLKGLFGICFSRACSIERTRKSKFDTRK